LSSSKLKGNSGGFFWTLQFFQKEFFFVAYVHFTSFTYILAFFSELSIFYSITPRDREIFFLKQQQIKRNNFCSFFHIFFSGGNFLGCLNFFLVFFFRKDDLIFLVVGMNLMMIFFPRLFFRKIQFFC